MKTTTGRTAAATRRLGRALARLAFAALAASTSSGQVNVNSTPAGARILIDGVDTGQQTPGRLTLSAEKERYTIGIEKSGYNPVAQIVDWRTDVDVIGAKEAACTVCISPCCCFLPLLRFLDPVDVRKRFEPHDLNVELEVAGQGARLEVKPSPFEVYLDGKLAALLEGNYLVAEPGVHDVEVRAAGHRPLQRSIRVAERIYQRLKIELEVEGQGLLVSGKPAGAKIYLDDQFQGTLGSDARRVRADAGPHLLRIEADGRRTWQDVVNVVADRFQELAIELELEGEGIIVRKPEGLPAKTPEIQVLVDGKLQGSAFDAPIRTSEGDHEIEIRVVGREPRVQTVSVAKGAWITLEPGAKSDYGSARNQKALKGVRLHAPAALGELAPQDVEVRVDGLLISQRFEEVIDLTARSDGTARIEVRVRGCKPWSDTIKVARGVVLDLYPPLEKE